MTLLERIRSGHKGVLVFLAIYGWGIITGILIGAFGALVLFCN